MEKTKPSKEELEKIIALKKKAINGNKIINK